MISKKEYKSYLDTILGFQDPCWHCGKFINKDEEPYYKIVYTVRNDAKTPHKYIYFHAECFKEVAGEMYMFEE